MAVRVLQTCEAEVTSSHDQAHAASCPAHTRCFLVSDSPAVLSLAYSWTALAQSAACGLEQKANQKLCKNGAARSRKCFYVHTPLSCPHARRPCWWPPWSSCWASTVMNRSGFEGPGGWSE